MATQHTTLNKKKLGLALQRLELLIEPDSQQLLDGLQPQQAKHLPQLSQELKRSPYQLKKKLDALKDAGLVFSPKRYPQGYSVNKMKCVKINLRAKPFFED